MLTEVMACVSILTGIGTIAVIIALGGYERVAQAALDWLDTL